MIELHHAPSTAAMAPHILLTEIGVPFVLRPVDTAAQAHRTPVYLALNPNGRVPVLVDGDLVLYESAAICLHLADLHPQAGPELHRRVALDVDPNVRLSPLRDRAR